MLRYCNTTKLLRKPEVLVRMAGLECVKRHFETTIKILLPLPREKDLDEPLMISSLHAKSFNVATSLAMFLLDGMDLNMNQNFIWDPPIPKIPYDGDGPEDKVKHDRLVQEYILQNNLKIIGVTETERPRTPAPCFNLQQSIDQIYRDIYNEKLEKMNELLASGENRNSDQFCSKLTSYSIGLDPALFREGGQYYDTLGYNPNDINVSRDNPDPRAKSFAYAGRIANPNSIFSKFGKLSMNHIKNINTGMPINSNCFKKLHYYGIDFPLSKKLNNNGKYISEKDLNKQGGHAVLLQYYQKYQI